MRRAEENLSTFNLTLAVERPGAVTILKIIPPKGKRRVALELFWLTSR
jgi:hypothetical protein